MPLQVLHFSKPFPLQKVHFIPPFVPEPLQKKHLNGPVPDPLHAEQTAASATLQLQPAMTAAHAKRLSASRRFRVAINGL
jgi:hypothetical protein